VAVRAIMIVIVAVIVLVSLTQTYNDFIKIYCTVFVLHCFFCGSSCSYGSLFNASVLLFG